MTIARLPHLNFPPLPLKLNEQEGSVTIFDEIRRKWVICQPEEWVRQHVILFLKIHKQVPVGLMAIERKLPGTSQRADVVVFSKAGEALLLVECKAPEVRLNREVFKQTSRYNMRQSAAVWWVTNGLNHFVLERDHENPGMKFLPDVPDYKSLNDMAKNNL